MRTRFLLLLFLGTLCFAGEGTIGSAAVAVVLKMEGKAKLLPANSLKKHRLKVGEHVAAGDQLFTYADSSAVLKFNDASVVVLDENARLLLHSELSLQQKSGAVYYRIEKRSRSGGLKVETPFSIIGIKGTEFIVDFKGSGRIALNEGVVAVTSPQERFELYRQREMSDFERYQQQQDRGFKAYKRRIEEQIAAYLVSFDLQRQQMLTFQDAGHCKEACGSQVFEEGFTPEIKARFKYYQQLAEE